MLYFVVAPPTCTTTGTVVLPSLMRIWLGLRLKPLIVIFAVSSVGIALMVTKSELSSGFSATVYFRTLDWNAGVILPAETVRFFRVASAAAPVLLCDSGETAPGLSVFLSHVKMLGGSARAFASVLQFGGTILDVHQEQCIMEPLSSSGRQPARHPRPPSTRHRGESASIVRKCWRIA